MDIDDIDLGTRSRSAIRLMRRRCAHLPIRMEMRPFRNAYTGDIQGVVLTDLYADRPGEGAGSSAMATLRRTADEMQVSVYTDAEGPRSHAFYLAQGFERSQGRGHMLAYHPPFEHDDMHLQGDRR